jgi:hypothetical protein
MEIVRDIVVQSDRSHLYNIITDTRYENVQITSLFGADFYVQACIKYLNQLKMTTGSGCCFSGGKAVGA